MSTRQRKPALTADQLLIAWQSASLLLSYPDESLLERLPLIRSASHQVPPGIGHPLRALVHHLDSTPLTKLQQDYVETFDSRRRCNLFLTYFAHGDTRKRGLALLRFKQTYLGSGFDLDDSELPDHLCVVLEYAATIDQQRGRQLMLDHRAGLELLRLSLRDAGSPWRGALDAVTATLPPLGGDEEEAIRRLALQGPPEEEVGLAPFAAPRFSPSTAAMRTASTPADNRVLLPVPTFPRGGV
jgi:nitrate reductase delta subunit